jgi:hypothetical protein
MEKSSRLTGKTPYTRIGKVVFDALAVGFVGELLADLRQIVLTVGMLNMGQEFRSFLHQVTAPAPEIAGGAHFGGIDRGLGELPPRSKTAILWASLVSFLALPP